MQDQASSDKGRAVDKRDPCKAQETSDPLIVADCRYILDQIIPLHLDLPVVRQGDSLSRKLQSPPVL